MRIRTGVVVAVEVVVPVVLGVLPVSVEGVVLLVDARGVGESSPDEQAAVMSISTASRLTGETDPR